MRNQLLILAIAFSLAGTRAGAQEQQDTTAVQPQAPLMDYSDAKTYIVDKIKVNGIKYFDQDILINSSGMSTGDTITIPGEYISQAIRNLWDLRYFSDVKIYAEPKEGGMVDLEIVLKERPKVYRWKVEGVRPGEADELIKKNLNLKTGSELSDYVLTNSVELIKKYFREKGFRNAEVAVQIANDSVMQNALNVTFVVNKNHKVKIGEINFVGNEVFSDKKLRRTFKKTHVKNANILQPAKFKEKDYEEDKEKLIDFYNSKGYRNAAIVSDSIYTINKKRMGITVNVDEGKKFYYRNISWIGNSLYDTPVLDALLSIKKGETYDKKTLYKRLGYDKENNPEDPSTISSLYQNKGYLYFQLDPEEKVVGEDSVDLNIKIFEGKPFTVNEVTFTGNNRVNDQVIRRELDVMPGELYDRSLLMSSMRRLTQMQHFNPEAISPMPKPISDDLVDISFSLEEQASDKFEISGGWGAGMFVGSIGIQLNNVSIGNFFKKGQWRPYPHGQGQQLSIRAQTNGTYYKAFSLGFTEPWLGGKKPNSLNVSAYYSDESNAYYMWQKGNKHFRTIGLSVGLGRRLKWPDRFFTMYTELMFQSYNLKDWDYFLIQNGSSNIIALKLAIERNSVDQPIYPRRGSNFVVSLALTPPYSLFDGKDYKDPNLSDNKRYKLIEYHKWMLKGQWFFPLLKNEKLVLMASAEMGYIGSYNKYKPSPFEGFDVGGDGMSGYNVYGVDVIGLRGYSNGALTPGVNNWDYAKAYNKYTVELRYPVIMQPSSTIYGLVFAEGGNAFNDWKSFNPFLIKRSMGVGVRMYLPIVGMLGVDWAHGFDTPNRGNEDKKNHFHFTIGMQF
ncbi:MAG: outer membrane protein assembly factor BamA [Rikenellaceae bacterium]|nr:outer membrane protein assembly factor BamA [Rikenellaceae bacterium]